MLAEFSTLFATWSAPEWLALLLTFVWSGFVRGGLGFGGAGLALPILLIILPNPVFWLPIVGWHLLFFTFVTLARRHGHVDWAAVWRGMRIMIIPKLIGVLGLISLPSTFLALLVYGITLAYGLMYLFDFTLKSLGDKASRWHDRLMLMIGGYVSGTSLVGAPIIAAVYAHWVDKARLRDTMYVLWIFMVAIKMSTFVAFDMPLQWRYSLIFLLPAALGHWIGNHWHNRLVAGESKHFIQWIGAGLTAVCIVGIIRVLAGSA